MQLKIKRQYQRMSGNEREQQIAALVIKTCTKDTLGLDTKDHVNWFFFLESRLPHVR